MNMMLNIVKGRHCSVKTQTYYYLRLMLQKLPYKCLHESKTEKKSLSLGVIVLTVIHCIRVLHYEEKC